MKSEVVALIVTIALAFGGGVAWLLDIQKDVNEVLRNDSVWKANAEGEHDETRRWMCHWQHASHLDCKP